MSASGNSHRRVSRDGALTIAWRGKAALSRSTSASGKVHAASEKTEVTIFIPA